MKTRTAKVTPMKLGFKKAKREQLKAKIALLGASGHGKTVGSLLLAYGLVGDWEKIGLIDTEHNRSKTYVGSVKNGTEIGEFLHMEMPPSADLQMYHEAIETAEEAGLECLIIDSFSHAWYFLNDWVQSLGGEFHHWKKPKQEYRKLIERIMHSPLHIIVTIRQKQDYAIVPGAGRNGKAAVQKLGMKPVQDSDLEYEFLLTFQMEEGAYARASKDNTDLFVDFYDRLSAEHGAMLKSYLVDGLPVKSVIEKKKELIEKINAYCELDQKIKVFIEKKKAQMEADLKDWDLKELQGTEEYLRQGLERKKQTADGGQQSA